ncbi:MAG: hypothetical protein HZA14_10670 [Nitrospirae bacterium]|nr:hypothetical protein [Nitrospirota bacterium]
MTTKLRDIIEIPEVKLVIELDDADKDPSGITSSFVFTGEIQDSLDAILNRINKGQGCGVFIKGNYGSGKSHFLSYLYLLLKNKAVSNTPPPHPLPQGEGELNAFKISLVKYPASRSLESIVLSSLGYKGEVTDRQETFKGLINDRTVIIIDELSEFLRSKPASSAFYEDIRFLQFLGEFSFHQPLWIIASLQEWIEETGHISSNIFNRIKDRYPLRINLSSSHIEDIIDRRIIIKKEGAEDVIKSVFFELKKYYPHMLIKYDDFRKTYPLHPFTVRFLSGLTPVFSQHRGVIHFVFSEAGKILDEPVDVLITPDAIFNHFEERIREAPEYSPLVRVVYDYYRDNIGGILDRPEQREAALAAIKILILTEISPFEKRKTAKELAEILLKKISTLTSQINYEFIKDGVLEPLASHQMYINKEGDAYYADPRVDEGLRIKARIKALRERFEDRDYLFSEICNLLNLQYLPLRDVKEGRKYKFLWQNSLRECAVYVNASEHIKRTDMDRMLEGLEKRLDGYFIILSPFSRGKAQLTALLNTFSSPFLSALTFWMPRGMTDEEALFVEEFIAKSHLVREFPAAGAQVKKDEAEFREVMTRIYFEGEIFFASGGGVDRLKEIGYLPVEKLLAHLFDRPLSDLHPNHYKIMPRVEYFSSHHIAGLFSHFIKQGKITLEDAEKKGLTPYIKGLLEPLGIIKKKGGSFLISLDVENELVSQVLNLISQEDSLQHLKTSLRKGKWGMGEEQINLLISAFIASGHLTPYGRDELVELKEITQLATGEIMKLRAGKTLLPDLLGYLHLGKFIWGEVEDVPTPLTQKLMWKETSAFVRKGRELLKSVSLYMEKYRDYSILKKLRLDSALLNKLSLFFNSMPVSLQPAEGIERTLAYLKDNPNLEGELKYLEKVHAFFSDQIQMMNKYYLYLSHPSLRLPAASGLDEAKGVILSAMEDYLNSFSGEFSEIKDKWEDFYTAFTTVYREGHEAYYQSPAFNLRREVEESEEAKILKRISAAVQSLTFELDWWELRQQLDRLPAMCREDLGYELFNAPVCKCNFRTGDEPPQVENDFMRKCRAGILNFLKLIQAPENREKIDSYLLGISDSGRKDIAGKISSIMNSKLSEAGLPLIYPLLTDEALEEMEKAFKGRWKVKEVRVRDFIDSIKGRRMKYGELRNLFFKWLGGDEETIVWIKDEDEYGVSLLREELCKYGPQGNRISREIAGDTPATGSTFRSGVYKGDGLRQAEERLREEGRLELFDGIKLTSFSTDELFSFLNTEKIAHLKKRLREELFLRLWGKIINEDKIRTVEDEAMKDLLNIIRLSGEESRYKGVDKFTKVIAPMNLIIEKLRHENAHKDNFSGCVMEKIEERFGQLFRDYEKSGSGGANDITGIKERLQGLVVIFDGLRYDLWLMLRDALINEGMRLGEEAFVINAPTSTLNFRKAMGLEDEGLLNGRSYVHVKWAEKASGKKELRKVMKLQKDIKFLHFNLIDSKVHGSTLDLYPLFLSIKSDFISGIIPLLKEMNSFYIISDHGFTDTKRFKDRYAHGSESTWETVLPFAEARWQPVLY